MTTIQKRLQPTDTFLMVADFSRTLQIDAAPRDVASTAALLMLDLIGVLAAASLIDGGRIARDFAARHWAPSPQAPSARLLFDGRPVSLPGFGFAMATQIDSLDAHDGYERSSGHAGAALFPALCAFSQPCPGLTGAEALAAFVAGYEIAYRAGLALHATVSDFHTSGAWNALGCVAIGARLRRLDDNTFRHALGIAEYHAPRSQMMREIANPSMLHDGTGWGAPTAVSAVLLAEQGFTGAPAAIIEFDDAAFAWRDLGQVWLTNQQYVKPYPVCRWAHAAVDAALRLRRDYRLTAEMIESVEVRTFAYAAALSASVPSSSAEAQYSLSWPVAAALVRGRVGVNEVLETSFSDPAIAALTRRIQAVVDPDCEAVHAERWLAELFVTLKDGRTLHTGPTEATGGPDPQPSPAEIIGKFHDYADPVLGPSRAGRIEKAVMALADPDSRFQSLTDLLIEKPGC